MKSYHPSNSSIHILSRIVIIQGDSVLLCKHKDRYFLPGGHVENGESLIGALERELVEELGTFPHSEPVHIGVCEHTFDVEDEVTQHEINHIFVTEVDESTMLASKESHLSFVKVKISDLSTVELLPKQLKPTLINWFENKTQFFIGM